MSKQPKAPQLCHTQPRARRNQPLTTSLSQTLQQNVAAVAQTATAPRKKPVYPRSNDKLLFSNLSLLGFQFDEQLQKHRIDLKKDLFRKPSWKTFEVVFAFLMEESEVVRNETELKDVLLLTGRKREVEFRKIILRWYKSLQDSHSNCALVPNISHTTWMQPYGDSFVSIVTKISTVILMEKMKREGFDILPPPVDTKNQIASVLSKKIYYQAASSNFTKLQNLENSSLKDYREAVETSKLLSNRIKEVKHECLQKREELKEALNSSSISPDMKEKLFDLEDDSTFEELEKKLVDTRKNYNCYVEKIERYSRLVADCRSSCDRVVSLYNNPPILDFTAISSLLGKINKELPPLTLTQIISGVRKVFKVLCEDFKNVPLLPEANTDEKLKHISEISKDAEEMEVWLTNTISEQNKSLSLLRQKHAVNGGLASMLMSFSTISWPSYNDVASVAVKPTELYTETPDEMLARYKAESVKRLEEERKKPVLVVPMSREFENSCEVSAPPCSSGVSEHYFSVSQQRQYQIHRDTAGLEYSNSIPTFKARPVPSSTYKPKAMIGRSQDVFDKSLFEYTKVPSKLGREPIQSSSTSSDVSDSIFSPPQGSYENANNVEREELSRMKLFDWSETAANSDQFINLSLNLESKASPISVDEVDSPVMTTIEDLSFGQLEIEEEVSRLFGNKRQSNLSASDSSVLQESLLNIDSLDLDFLT